MAASVFQNHVRDRVLLCVGQGEMSAPAAEALRDLCRFAVEHHGGPSTGFADYLEIMPGHATAHTRPDRLHRGFFRRKTGCKPFYCIGFGLAVPDFSGGEDAAQEPVPEPFDGLRNSRNLDDVNARAENHDISLPSSWPEEGLAKTGGGQA